MCIVGEKVNYYNSNYQVVYDQLETQTNSFSVIAMFFADNPSNIAGTFQLCDFTYYTIDYLAVGIKYRF